MFAPLVDFFTGRTSAWKAKYNAAFVTLVNPDTGEPYTASGGGGGGGSGSITAAGVNGTLAQAVQGINGGVALPVSAAALPLPTDAATSALQTTGNTSLGNIDGKLPALVSGRFTTLSSVPVASTGTILALTTNATGTTYTAFASQACTSLDIVNNTGTTIEYRRNGAGVAMQIPTGAARMVIAITNANQVDVRRTDTSNTTVTLQAEAFVN